jgi:predicted enzyme related to lactoylglutathione lyase
MAGEIVHFEVPAADVDRAVAFWSGLFRFEIGPACVDTEGTKFSLWQSDPNAA